MEHIKIFQSQFISSNAGQIIIEGPVEPLQLAKWTMHKDLDAFRNPEDQQEALIEIAELPEGRIIIARKKEVIVGYVTFHYPDEMERWSQGHMQDLLELGAIEVANEFRFYGLGRTMIKLAFSLRQLEKYIVFTTEYYWHWDLQTTKLSVWEYRAMMEKLMKSVHMVWYATDDPEICSHPANCLMVRIGQEVTQLSIEQFDRIRFQRRIMY